jgi:hypothetical protein
MLHHVRVLTLAQTANYPGRCVNGYIFTAKSRAALMAGATVDRAYRLAISDGAQPPIVVMSACKDPVITKLMATYDWSQARVIQLSGTGVVT